MAEKYSAGPPPRSKPFKCTECEYRAKSRKNVQRHATGVHSNARPFACTECPYTAKFMSYVILHKQNRHEGRGGAGNKLVRKCPFANCPYETVYPSALANHKRTHTKEKPFACTWCDYRSTTSGHLSRHVRSHTKEKPFKCELCLEEFSHMANLETHIRVHTGENPFMCTICDYGSKQGSQLFSHMSRKHGNKDERPFKCSVDGCLYAAKLKCGLKSHMMTHSEEKPFACPSCSCRFKTKQGLRNHFKNTRIMRRRCK